MKLCPKCASKNYAKQLSPFRTIVEYADTAENMEYNIDPAVGAIYNKIGAETVEQETDTLENIFGTKAVSESIVESDE